MSVNVVALVTIKAGQDAAFIAAAQTCVLASRAEDGVLRYDLWQEQEGEERFVFDELYVDDAAVQATWHPTTSRLSVWRRGTSRRPGPRS